MSIFNNQTHRTGNGLDQVRTTSRELTGLGYIVLNSNEERETHINNCHRTNTVMIVTLNRDIVKRCIVSKNVWDNIEFPLDNNNFGSMVCWINIQAQDTIVITSVIDSKQDFTAKSESSFLNEKKSSTAHVKVHGNGLDGTWGVVTGNESNTFGPKMFMKAITTFKNALFSIFVSGKFIIETTGGDIDLRTDKQFKTIIKDEDIADYEFEDSLTINKDKFEVSNHVGVKILVQDRFITIKNEETSLYTIMKDILIMYMKTKTIDGKVIDPSSVDKATKLLTELSKLLKK